MASQVFQFSHSPVHSHAFSQDRKTLAISKETYVEIYDVSNPTAPKLITVLKDHDKTVTAVDISIHGRIVTSSQDRNAIVWEPLSDGTYKPTLVLLRINRAATCVKWAPNGFKFAVGSGARVIAVCYFEQENDWWISKHIKKPIRSTILSIEWHPNNVLLAAGSTDGHARVFSGFIKGIDTKPEPSLWGEKLPFNTLTGDFVSSNGGWVHDVAFSADGNILAFVSHDSSLTIVYPGGADAPPKSILSVSTSLLPFTSVIFKNDHTIIAAGHDCHPVVFEGDESNWVQSYSIDDPKDSKVEDAGETSALNMFKQLDLKGTLTNKNSSTLKTIHQNSITQIRPYAESNGEVSKFSSSGIDGRIVIFSA
jgi:actin related protein 2/3 complex subunit 1A/1B